MEKYKENKISLFLLILSLIVIVTMVNLITFTTNRYLLDPVSENIDIDINEDGQVDYIVQIASLERTYDVSLDMKSIIHKKYLQEKNYKVNMTKNNKTTGIIDITFQKVLDNSYNYFIEFTPLQDDAKVNISIISKNMGNGFSLREAFYKENQMDFKYTPYSFPRKLSNTSNYIDGQNGKSMRLGKVYHTKDLGSTVIDIQTIEDLHINVTQKESDMIYTIPLWNKKEYATRTEGILSLKPLVNWEKDFAYATTKVMDLTNQKLFWKNGIYYPTPSTYIPSTETSFYRTPSALQIRSAFWVLEDGELFRNHGISMMYAYAEAYDSKNFIPTAPESTWLQEDYGIGSKFYDTRFNTDTIMALMNIYTKYPDEVILQKINDYFLFFKDFSEKHSFSIEENQIYVPDYIDYEERNKKTHSSLNHTIAEMIVLYQYYQLNNDQTYLDMAHRLRDTILSSYKNWIKEDGDLWYGITPDGKFIKNDYPLVTYNDLKYAEYYLKNIDGVIPYEWKILIESKEIWAKKEGYLKNDL